MDFYDEFGNHQSELFADSGRYFEKTNDLMAWSNVIVVSDSGVVLETEVLKWDNRRQKIHSVGEVIFFTLSDTLFGDYFESDPDLQNYQISNPRGISHRRSDDD